MGITRKFVFPLMLASLIAIPIFPDVNADKNSAVFNGDRILVVDNGFEFEIEAFGSNSQEILKNGGIVLHQEDIIFSEISGDNQRIIILRAIPVTLNVLGETQEIYTHKKTVKEVLEEEDVELLSSQVISYSLDEAVFPEIEIKISKKPESEPKLQPEPQAETEPKPTPKPKQKPNPKVETAGEAQVGSASWYSYIPGNYCASLRFPRGTRLRVTNVANGRSVIVTVNDSGPFNGRVIDLERNAFSQIAPLSAGVARVRVERIK